ncbi:MAG: DUF6531 domain-containing protein [Bdellovibrionota bacterium]
MKNLILITLGVIPLGLLLNIPLSKAAVNLQTGGLVKHFVDYRVRNRDKELIFERVYRSRSFSSGYFGYGWCSVFDEKLKFIGKNVQIDFCNDESTINLSFKKANLWLSPTYTLRKNSNGYILENKEGILRFYDSSGWLSFIKKGLEITRLPDGTPTTVSIGLTKFNIEMSFDGQKIIQINSNKKIKTEYSYKNNQLTGVLQNNSLKQTYVYDEDDNLLEIKNSGKLEQEIKYDTVNDRVVQIKDQEQCSLVYQYDQLNSSETITRVLKQCEKKQVILGETHFWYESLSKGKVNLTKYEARKR